MSYSVLQEHRQISIIANSVDPTLTHSATHQVIESNSSHSDAHAADVREGDWVLEEQEGGADDHDPLGHVGHGVTDWRHDGDDRERHKVLGKRQKSGQWKTQQ